MLDLTPAWVATCASCAAVGVSHDEEHDTAHVDLRLRGWTRGDRTLCPGCSATPALPSEPLDEDSAIVCPKCLTRILVDRPAGTHYTLIHEGDGRHTFAPRGGG